jgi:hypothetical protein
MKELFDHSVLDFHFGTDDLHYMPVMRFYQRQMELLYDMPSIPPRPIGVGSWTYYHSMRVAQDVYEFSRFVGLSENISRNLKFAAELHDIGKLDVPVEILDKPGRLTDEEFTEIKRHTDYGADRLEASGITHPLIYLSQQLAFYHHERPDGKGYHGLAGSEMPMRFRLIQICDIYDALSAERPYRPKEQQLSPAQTLAMMTNPESPLYAQVDQGMMKKFALLKANTITAVPQGDDFDKILERVSKTDILAEIIS